MMCFTGHVVLSPVTFQHVFDMVIESGWHSSQQQIFDITIILVKPHLGLRV